jgi:hypothetical protein
MTGDIVCRVLRMRTGANTAVTAGRKITLNTMGYSICTTRMEFEQNNITGNLHEIVFNMGSNAPILNEATNTFANVVYFLGTPSYITAITFAQFAGKVTTFNLHAGIFKITGNGPNLTIQFYGIATATVNVNAGTSTLILGDRTVATTQQSITFNSRGKTFYNIKADIDSAIYNVTFGDLINCNRLLLEPGTICFFAKDVYHTFQSYVDGDWDGNASKYVKIRTAPENNYNYLMFNSAPSKFYVRYLDVKDSACITHVINAWSVPNGGTNIETAGLFFVNWVFNIPQVLFSAFWARFRNLLISNQGDQI